MGMLLCFQRIKILELTFFVNKRNRDWYDFNNDNYSEIPIVKNNNFGVNFFFLPSKNQKFEVNLASINEYRYGGEMVNRAPHLSIKEKEMI